ncbi:type II secretion system protein [Candidatus Peregrinibacteria bacterium]|nr:type II secretion system protein [Candidatus Peregrinibacteria bacterium]
MTLIEVLVALFVIGTIIAGSVIIISTAFGSITRVEDRLMAQNMAREGIEVVRNIILTNSIKYSDPKCWNKKQLPCENDSNKLSGAYTVKHYMANNKFETSLEEKTSPFYLPSDPAEPEKKKLNPIYIISLQKTESEGFYTNDAKDPKENTKFYRKIDISYDEGDLDRMLIKSTVAWIDGEIKIENTFNKK